MFWVLKHSEIKFYRYYRVEYFNFEFLDEVDHLQPADAFSRLKILQKYVSETGASPGPVAGLLMSLCRNHRRFGEEKGEEKMGGKISGYGLVSWFLT